MVCSACVACDLEGRHQASMSSACEAPKLATMAETAASTLRRQSLRLCKVRMPKNLHRFDASVLDFCADVASVVVVASNSKLCTKCSLPTATQRLLGEVNIVPRYVQRECCVLMQLSHLGFSALHIVTSAREADYENILCANCIHSHLGGLRCIIQDAGLVGKDPLPVKTPPLSNCLGESTSWDCTPPLLER